MSEGRLAKKLQKTLKSWRIATISIKQSSQVLLETVNIACFCQLLLIDKSSYWLRIA